MSGSQYKKSCKKNAGKGPYHWESHSKFPKPSFLGIHIGNLYLGSIFNLGCHFTAILQILITGLIKVLTGVVLVLQVRARLRQTHRDCG